MQGNRARYCGVIDMETLHLIIKITISSIVIGLKTLLFSTNSLARLLSDSLLSGSLLLDTLLLDSLLSDSSIGQSHSKLYFKSTNHIQSCNDVRACARLLLCFWRLITGRRFFISFVGILMRIFPFFHNLAILFSKIVIFMINW